MVTEPDWSARSIAPDDHHPNPLGRDASVRVSLCRGSSRVSIVAQKVVGATRDTRNDQIIIK